MTNRLQRCVLDSPLGRLEVLATEQGLCALLFEDHRAGIESRVARRFSAISIVDGDLFGAGIALQRWFEGQLDALDGLPVDPGGTAFQRSAWEVLRRIPPGQTRSYGQLAEDIGRPRAARAVGAANGANPLPIVVPCHRVIGSDGSLTGFAYGIERKRWLLDFEKKHASLV